MKRRVKKISPKKLYIRNVAIKLFAKYGFERVSITDIAEKAKVNVSMISYYFGGKTELYDLIIEDLFSKQNNFLSNFITLNDFHKLHHEKKISVFTEIMCSIVSIFYENISADLVMIVFREQQNQNVEIIQKSPGISYVRNLIADILDENPNDKKVIHCLISILALLSAPRLLPGFSLGLLDQSNLKIEDIELIKSNIKVCVPLLLKKIGCCQTISGTG